MEIIELLDSVDKQVKNCGKKYSDFILNNSKFLPDLRDKIVLKEKDSIIRIGTYNTLYPAFYFLQYLKKEKPDINFFLPQILIKDYGWCIVTKQEVLDEIYSLDKTEDFLREELKTAYGEKSLNFLKDFGIYGIGNCNMGLKNNNPVIIDWFGGPILVGKELKTWSGEVLMEIKEV